MNTSAEAADQIVRMSLNGTETALKLTGTGAKEMAKLLYALLKDLSTEKNKTKGQMRLNNLVKSGKKLEIYKVADTDLNRFCSEAKKYGIIYTILKDKNSKSGFTEIMVKSEDKKKIDYVYDRLGLAPVNLAEVRPDKSKDKDGQPAPEKSSQEKTREEAFLDELLKTPTKEKGQNENPTQERTTKNRSVPSLNRQKKKEFSSYKSDSEARPSVRKELNEIKKRQEAARRAEQTKNRGKTKTSQQFNEHKNVPKKKKYKER